MAARVTRPRLILASASPRRLALLEQIGVVPDEVRAADIDETSRKAELPHAHAARLAGAKATAIVAPGALVLAADTVVAAGRRILPKAEQAEQARACLELLSGRRHRVVSAVVLLDTGGRRRERLVTSRVGFARLSAAQIDDYLAGDEWRGKAGGYAIQGRAGGFVRFLSGSYSNVVGMPLFETAQLLRGAGWLVP